MANEMRDRLVELLLNGEKQFFDTKANRTTPLQSYLANHLIENGVILLPCKVGTDLYLSDYLDGHHRLKEYKFLGNEIAVVIDCWEWQRTCTRMLSDFGKTVFLTKEQAEQKLKEMRGNSD